MLAIADVSYDDRQLAKDNRFHWVPEKKIWCKEIKQIDYDIEVSEYPFETTFEVL